MKLLPLSLLLFLAAAFTPDQPTAMSPGQDPLQPGPQHARLQALAGTWDAVIVTTDMQRKEQRVKGTLTTRKHAGCHTVDDFQGQLMGMPLVGHGINGFCPVRKQYFTFWTDSMTPSPMTLWGDYDDKAHELRLTGECYGMSGKLEPCRTVTKYEDGDHYSWSMFGAGPDGKEMQHLRIEYTRRK
jgi:hypothetical protein